MAKTKIEWAEHSWNVITGCTKISAGCKNCYAERMARRLAGRCGYPEAPNHFDVTFHPSRLSEPFDRTKPTTYFVCSMGDLFHEDVQEMWLQKIFLLMAAIDRHTFLLLTKRPQRMLDFYNSDWCAALKQLYGLRNIWLGVTAETQAMANKRIPILLEIPTAAPKFVSCEPLLERIDLQAAGAIYNGVYPNIDWVIVGGESGPGARPMLPDWAYSIRDQCQGAGTLFLFKQWGAWTPHRHESKQEKYFISGNNTKVAMWRVGKKKAGRLLGGREYNGFPKWTS